MGEVFEARHVDLGSLVAIKVMHASVAADGATARQVLREGRAAAAIRHPNVVSVFDVGLENDRPYLVMELLEGEDLGQYLAGRGPLALEDALQLVLPIVSAIAAAHDAGVVHRDLKPSNVVLTSRRGAVEPVVVDFGISKVLTSGESATSSRAVAGTPQYMAPELLRSPRNVSQSADQYGLGVLLYQCVTGGTPFWGDDYYELLHAIMTAQVLNPTKLNPSIPPEFGSIVMRALARDPAARFRDVRTLGAELLPYARHEDRVRWAAEFGPKRSSASGGFSYDRNPVARLRFSRAKSRALALVVPIAAIGCVAILHSATRMSHQAISGATAGTPAPAPSTTDLDRSATNDIDVPRQEVAAGVSSTAPSVEPPAIPAGSPPSRPRARATPAEGTVKATASVAPTPLPAPIERGTGNIPILE
jgi:serine/threonine-protein kinase